MEWISTEDRLPDCWESDIDWDGLKSDEVLIMTENNVFFLVTAYEGTVDGSKFYDWYNDRDDSIDEKITFWAEIKHPSCQ